MLGPENHFEPSWTMEMTVPGVFPIQIQFIKHWIFVLFNLMGSWTWSSHIVHLSVPKISWLEVSRRSSDTGPGECSWHCHCVERLGAQCCYAQLSRQSVTRGTKPGMMKYAESIYIQGSSIGREGHWTSSWCASHLIPSLSPGSSGCIDGHHHLLLHPGVPDHHLARPGGDDHVPRVVRRHRHQPPGGTKRHLSQSRRQVGELMETHIRRKDGQDLLQSLGATPVSKVSVVERHMVRWGRGRQWGR